MALIMRGDTENVQFVNEIVFTDFEIKETDTNPNELQFNTNGTNCMTIREDCGITMTNTLDVANELTTGGDITMNSNDLTISSGAFNGNIRIDTNNDSGIVMRRQLGDGSVQVGDITNNSANLDLFSSGTQRVCVESGGDVRFLNQVAVAVNTSPQIDLAVGEGDTGLHNAANQELAIYTGGNERVRIDSSGNMGIGTNNPGGVRLHTVETANGRDYSNPYSGVQAIIEDNGDSVVLIAGGNTANSEIWFGDTDSDNKGRVRYEHDNDTMEFWSNGVMNMFIDSTGEVDIPNGILSIGDDMGKGGDGLITDFQNGNEDNTVHFLQVPWVNTRAIENWSERGTASSAICFGTTQHDNTADKISLITNGDTKILVESSAISLNEPTTIDAPLDLTGTFDLTLNGGLVIAKGAGSHLFTRIQTDTDFSFTNTTTSTNGVWREIVGSSGNYTPVHNNSYIIIEAFFRYTINGNSTDQFASRITVEGTVIQQQEQDYDGAGGGGTRSQTLFPIKGRYENNTTSTRNIDIDFQRSSGGDTCTINTSHCWIQITEIAR